MDLCKPARGLRPVREAVIASDLPLSYRSIPEGGRNTQRSPAELSLYSWGRP